MNEAATTTELLAPACMTGPFPHALDLLEAAHSSELNNHYDDGLHESCAGCERAFELRLEIEALRAHQG